MIVRNVQTETFKSISILTVLSIVLMDLLLLIEIQVN